VIVKQRAMQQFSRGLKIGDQVDITFTDALAVSVVPPGH